MFCPFSHWCRQRCCCGPGAHIGADVHDSYFNPGSSFHGDDVLEDTDDSSDLDSGTSDGNSDDGGHSCRSIDGYNIAACRPIDEATLSRFSVGTSANGRSSNGDQAFLWTASLEHKWRLEMLPQNIALGARTLFVTGSVCLPIKFYYYVVKLDASEYVLDGTGISPCDTMTVLTSHALELRVAEMVFLVATLLVLCICMKRPHAGLYYPVLFAYFAYSIVVFVPPFGPSCAVNCRKYVDNKHDCTLQSFTNMQLMMVWILLTPYTIPLNSQMGFTWAWIVGGYLGTTLVLKAIQGDAYGHGATDIITCTGFLAAVNTMAALRKWYMEKGQRTRFKMAFQERRASKKLFRILQYMVPRFVISQMITRPGEVIARHMKCASILFIKFADFDQTARMLPPVSLLDLLNRRFSRFDKVCAANKVTKIETVGEEYMCAVGVLPVDDLEADAIGHGEVLGRLLHVALEILCIQSSRRDDMSLRMGVHTGPVVGGVIGQKLPRFRLFGDTVNTAARMMQKAPAGELLFGEATVSMLPLWARALPRGQVVMEGKGLVTVFLLDRNVAMPVETSPQRHALWRRLSSEREGDFTHQHGSGPFSVNEAISAPSGARNVSVGLIRELLDGGSIGGSYHSTSSTRNSAARTSNNVVCRGSPSAAFPSTNRVDTDAFDDVLRQVSSASLWSRATAGTKPCSGCSWVNGRAEGGDFSEAAEIAFRRWFHEHRVCWKLPRRLDRQAFFLVALTAVEGLYLVYCREAWGNERRYLVIFVAYRAACLVIIVVWRVAASTSTLVRTEAVATQRLLLFTCCLFAVLMFCSYVAANEAEDSVTHARLFEVLILPVYILVTTSHQLRFWHSCIFILVTAALVTAQKEGYFSSHVYLSEPGATLLVMSSVLHAFEACKDESALRSRFKAKHTLDVTHSRVEFILKSLLPPMVVDQLRRSSELVSLSHHYTNATVAQTDLVGFTRLASLRAPAEVVEIISEIFGLYDNLTDRYGVYKVETVGDAYIAGQAGPPLTSTNSPLSVVLFAVAAVEATNRWSQEHGEEVSCRVGVHSGECIGGIVGADMQRYHLFGALLSVVEVLEATAPAGRTQVSGSCRNAVEAQILAEGRETIDGVALDGFAFEARAAGSLVTSKGRLHSMEEVGGPTFLCQFHLQG
eukprot:TRINITY_DN22533_c0_g1_i4.p1 TRINITY_DN22533_c0_g1~~TRINITY_DN22533_c0_g1_i4.p1  ORF type:complete len:1152 (+),score=165.91 TRINITY_DN22533_c0_g1_i4:167-3622(+)